MLKFIKSLFSVFVAWYHKYATGGLGYPAGVFAIDDFGEAFAKSVARKMYDESITFGVANQQYEGEIKGIGDRVNILQFLHDISISDYVAGTDMSSQTLYDTESVLHINQQKYYNFPIDRTENVFTYPNDVADALVQNASEENNRTIDNFVLGKYADAASHNWVGVSLYVVGSSADTEASIATSATGGTIDVATADVTAEGQATTENPRTGNLLLAGFEANDVDRPIRLTSGSSWATAWYRITAVTDTGTVTVTNWDSSVAGPHIPNGDVLEGMRGASGGWQRYENDQNGDGKPTTEAGWGWELGAAESTTITAANVYEHITLLGSNLDRNRTPVSDRHLVLPPQGMALLRQASELQPSGIESIYRDTVINGRVMRIGGFDIHAAGAGRVSTRVVHSTSSGQGSDIVLTTGATRFNVPAWHKSFCTFAHKWQESRVVDAELQFAKRYQGLQLYGAHVTPVRRGQGAVLFASFELT